jgi:hypothetical protein
MGAELGVSSYRKISKSLVRRGVAQKGKFVSLNATCREMTMWFVETSRYK